MSTRKTGCLYSWPSIILAFIIFWPLGLFLLIKKAYSATAARKHYNAVKENVNKMFDKDFLKNTYTKKGEKAGASPSATPAEENASQSKGDATPPDLSPRVITCPCCGANNTVSGAQGECEYCQTILK